MSVKVQVVRNTSEGEHVSIETVIDGAADWDAEVKPILAKLDDRLIEHNQRYLDATAAIKNIPAEYQPQVQFVLQRLYGRQIDGLEMAPKIHEETVKNMKAKEK